MLWEGGGATIRRGREAREMEWEEEEGRKGVGGRRRRRRNKVRGKEGREIEWEEEEGRKGGEGGRWLKWKREMSEGRDGRG